MKKNLTSEEDIKKRGYDLKLIEAIQPKGGISFTDERYIKAGDGYEACIHIYEYPKSLDTHWLATVMNLNNVVAVLDISTEDKNVVKQNINRSMKEQNLRYNSATEATDQRDAQTKYAELDNMYEEISAMGEVAKLISIRLFISARTLDEADKEIEKYLNYLEGNGYKGAVFLNESKSEWTSMYQTYTQQQATEYRRYGQPILSEALAAGDPFHFTSLSDPHGTYLGTTVSTGGAVLFNMFEKTKKRLSYNAAIFGRMGAGKSTAIKKILLDSAIRGNYIRAFDVADEYVDLTNKLGGKVISLDGTDGILNALEVLKAGDNESISYTRHLSKLSTMYKFLAPHCNVYEVVEFEQLINDFYVDFGLIKSNIPLEEQQITGLPPESYPIWSDFVAYINRCMDTSSGADGIVKTEIEIQKMKRLDNVRLVISNLVQNYGYMFDGHTSVPNVLDTQIVIFNIKNLTSLKSEIFDAQIFTALLLCWDNCVKIGEQMKNLYDNHKINWEDIVRFTIIIDEAHKIVNANKLTAVDQLIVFEREARKYFGGLMLASQSIRDFVPQGSNSEGTDKIKTIFELAQYKFIMQQDSNTLDVLNNVFQYQLTDAELKTIPKLEQGECILAISSDRNIQFNIEITDQEKDLFKGGA